MDDSAESMEFSNVEPAAQSDREAMPVDAEQPPRLAFPVVGIGASAGGLEAFTEFFKAMPPDSGMAFVLIQHLPPDRESMIPDILARHTKMEVHQVEDAMAVEVNHVYVIRPGHTLTIQDGHLHLGERVTKPGHSRPVDDFFKSLAQEQRERAICIIMSGMGSNGTAGAQAVKAVGGLCIAQDPEAAQFPSMPQNLIDAGYADYVLPVAEVPDVLIAYARHPYATDRAAAEGALHIEKQHVREILAILRTRTRHDFTGYKKPTVMRRIQRRMGLNRVTDIGQYARILRQSPIEVIGLGDDLLIHVTGFFRDPDAWEALRTRVIVPLVAARDPHEPIRCWVAACSSGEEAYSLAMLLVEECTHAGKSIDIKVFATDTADRTLVNARNGVYPGGIEAEMPAERLARFFEKEEEVYRVRQDLRECVVFAPQNVLTDPPFSRLDIATCRNLLIYLEPEVQLRVISALHFGLRPGGALLLGTSETVPGTPGLFESIDKKARIYRRIGPTQHTAASFVVPRGMARGSQETGRESARLATAAPSIAQLTARALLAQHIPAAVTVDRNYRVVYYQGDTTPYLSQPSGEPTQDLVLLTNTEFRSAVRVALQHAIKENGVGTASAGWITNAEGERRRVSVAASPLSSTAPSELFVVSFQEREETEPVPGVDGEPGMSLDSRQAREEVQLLRDELQRTVEELQASNEEHKAAAEEAMSINEELQSSNEELETSKEEMQSLNEELSTVNAQLQAKMDELQKTGGDLRSLLSSTDIAVIFLDPQFRIRRYTPAARTLLELIGGDIGRPLNDLARKFVDPDLLDDAQAVLDRLIPMEREVRGDNGRWYLRRVLAYRTVDDRIEGVVITFVDISDRKRAESLMSQARDTTAGDLRAMDSLHAVSNHLIGAKNMQAVLDEILAAAAELHGSDMGAIHLVDASGSRLKLTVQRGFANELADRWSSVSLDDTTSAPARALSSRGPVVVDNLAAPRPAESSREPTLGDGVHALMSTPLVTRGGEPLGVLTICFHHPNQPDDRSMRITELLVQQGADTIERMRTEEELARLLKSEQLARRALDDAAEMKDQFLASLSHELRTPLSAILLWGQVLRRTEVGEKERSEGIGAIMRSAESQARLIDDLLDTSSIALGKLRLELTDVNLVDVIRAVIEQTAPAAQAKGLRIDSALSPEAGVVIADLVRIRQVAWNLLANAIKFTPNGGQISVRLERIGDGVVLTVRDSGVGIDPEFLPYVFDRFRQYDASITRKHGGLGLGLAITKQLVELHGGTIRAQSPGIGLGSTFTVAMPLAAVRRTVLSQASPAPGEDDRLSGRTVLLIEDEAATRGILARVLDGAGATVITAANGADALEAYRNAPPQIVLSDIGLPDVDGYQLLGQIRALERELHLPEACAVALTAYARPDDQRKAADAGFRVHVAKPVGAEELVATLAELIPRQ